MLVLQVDQLDAATRTGGGFNQPQYLHLKESISSIIQHLNNLQVGGLVQTSLVKCTELAHAGALLGTMKSCCATPVKLCRLLHAATCVW